ncbi:hypothetical protein [Leptospira johnsonii]|uniref:Outer membrane protein/protective antigen OMA87 n=1 Tax=Leptospira johnsonii TaxID=1917820 RepID=A0A2P2D7U6_9LEPT|nr:hypothetical protein [Leptospira johnsonii]GBF40702.1 outer membrane protein/protective antigen OMA87 [Leptospira johnsonii]
MKEPDIEGFVEAFQYACKKHNIIAAVLIPDASEAINDTDKVKFRIEGPELLAKIIHLGVQYFDLGIKKTKEKIEKPGIVTRFTKNFFTTNE